MLDQAFSNCDFFSYLLRALLRERASSWFLFFSCGFSTYADEALSSNPMIIGFSFPLGSAWKEIRGRRQALSAMCTVCSAECPKVTGGEIWGSERQPCDTRAELRARAVCSRLSRCIRGTLALVFRARALVLVLVPVLVLALSSMHTPIPSRRISDIRFLGHMTKSRGRKSFFFIIIFFFFFFLMGEAGGGD